MNDQSSDVSHAQPFVIYQSVEGEINPQQRSFLASTILWLGFKDPVKKGVSLRLHCRHVNIQKITVNGITAIYHRRDALKNLIPSKKKFCSGADLDASYRAALEIAREGELEIVIPDLKDSKYIPPKSIPKTASKDIIQRYEKLMYAYNTLSTANKTNPISVYDVKETEADVEVPHQCTFIQIRIKYQASESAAHSGVGIIYRQQSAFAKLFASSFDDPLSSNHGTNSKKVENTVVNAYTGSFTAGILRDYDGVRCWLPCIDALDQRSIFDISLVAPKQFTVISSGKKVHTVKQVSKSGMVMRKMHRFLTVDRIPAMQVGFFIGIAEAYKMAIYKARARILVTLGLRDFVHIEPEEEIVVNKDKLSTNKRPRPEDTSQNTHKKSVVISDNIQEEKKTAVSTTKTPIVFLQANKRRKSNHQKTIQIHINSLSKMDVEDDDDVPPPPPPPPSDTPIVQTSVKAANSTENPTQSTQKEKVTPKNKTSLKEKDSSHATNNTSTTTTTSKTHLQIIEAYQCASKLYQDKVHHSMLGFELALRLLHKFTGHKLNHDDITIIFVHDLGCHFMTFDSIIFINADFLHVSEQIYMETPCHLLLLQAYLYSWLKSSCWISSYEQEFVLHGIVGYLMSFYCEEVYGEDEGQYFRQKMYDTVLTLEKQGRAIPLSGFYPERYEVNSSVFSQYLVNKSACIFFIIDNIVGGKDAMRVALKMIINSPLLFTVSTFKGMAGSASNAEVLTDEQKASSVKDADGMSPLSPVMSSPQSLGDMSPQSTSMYSNFSPNGLDSPAHLVHSPGNDSYTNNGAATPFSPYAGYQSPFRYNGNMSPYIPFQTYSTAVTSATNNLGGQTPHYVSSGMVMLTRQNSNTSNTSATVLQGMEWLNDFNLLNFECFTFHDFLLHFRQSSDAAMELDFTLFDKMIYDTGVMLLRVDVSVTDRVENKPRKIYIRSDQVGYNRAGFLGQEFCNQSSQNESIEMPMFMVEERDDMKTELQITFNERFYVKEQQAHSRPGRRGGKKRKLKDTTNMTEQEIAQMKRRERERELLKSALQHAKDQEFPVRFVLLNSNFKMLVDVQNVSCDSLLIEQLNADYAQLGVLFDQHRIMLQCQALRGLSRAIVDSVDNVDELELQAAKPTDTQGKNSTSNTADADTMTGAIANKAKEKSARQQIKAQTDCILGITGSGLEAYTAGAPPPPPPLSIYVRAEAAFTLAAWQNENAPREINDILKESSGRDADAGQSWPGMDALIDCIFELFVDVQNQKPTIQDFRNEGNIYLRNSLLLALSTIRSQNGNTPIEVIETLLLFLEDLDNSFFLDHRQSASDSKHTANNESVGELSPVKIQYITALFIAVSRIRFHRVDTTSTTSTSNSSSATVTATTRYQAHQRIITIVREYMQAIFTDLRSQARIHFVANDANALPILPGNGLTIAAALTVMSEIDIQTCKALSEGKGKGEDRHYRLLDMEAPTGKGFLTHVPYLQYFMRPGDKLNTVLSDERASRQSAGAGASSLKEQFHYHLCTPVVRAAAFEAFARHCFAQHKARKTKLSFQAMRSNIENQQSAANTSNKGEEPESHYFVAAAVEALNYIFDNDPSIWVQQQAAQVFFEAILERPPRIALQGLSLGCALHCIGFSDIHALTLTPRANTKVPKVEAHVNLLKVKKEFEPIVDNREAMRASSKLMRIALDSIFRHITKKAAFNQVARTALMQAWLYVFRENIPRVFWTEDRPPIISKQSLLVSEETFAAAPLEYSRLVIRNPTEAFNEIEQMMRHGAKFTEGGAPVKAKVSEDKVDEQRFRRDFLSNNSAGTTDPSSVLKLSLSLGNKSSSANLANAATSTTSAKPAAASNTVTSQDKKPGSITFVL